MLARDPSRLEGRDWFGKVRAVRGDALDPRTLPDALAGVEVAYYLIHSMQRAGESEGDFHERDLAAAREFGRAARAAGVRRIVYLGGLGDPASELSRHLRSRQQTGDALRESGVPVTEFRAAIIVGSGSASFEMIRHLVERVPVMVCPRWVYTRVQPIAIRNVIDYLAAALDVPESAAQTIEIGGADVLTYGEMMTGYARRRGLRRALIPVPVLTPRLSSYWVHWVTPIPAEIAEPLIEGLRNEVVVRGDVARRLFPGIEPTDYATALDRALRVLETGEVETAWSDALVNAVGVGDPVVLKSAEGMLLERRQAQVRAGAEAVFREFTAIGGDRGWPSFQVLWRLRGLLDRAVGGVGLRRGRRDPDELRPGDALDFWRVEAVEPGRLLRLRAEMKVPGRAWLQFEAKPHGPDHTILVQSAYFAPKGLAGLAYWYSLYPIHGPIFSRMLQELARRAEART